MLRLDKYLADVGIGTRSEVKKYLKYGLVSVNGSIVKDSSLKVDPKKDKVTYKGEDLLYQEYRYYILNKPAGCVSATKDGLSQTVIEILKNEPTRDLFPVGRLDKDTEGLLLITNDGKLAHNLLSPKKHVDKSYIAFVDKALEEKQLLEFKQGLDIGDETPTLPCEIKLATENRINCAYSIECFELWYLLHFNYYDTGMHRNDYFEKLSQLLKQPYTKNNDNMYNLLKHKTNIAIKNARKLYLKQYTQPLSEQNPVTLVFELVEKLKG